MKDLYCLSALHKYFPPKSIYVAFNHSLCTESFTIRNSHPRVNDQCPEPDVQIGPLFAIEKHPSASRDLLGWVLGRALFTLITRAIKGLSLPALMGQRQVMGGRASCLVVQVPIEEATFHRNKKTPWKPKYVFYSHALLNWLFLSQ